MIRLFRKIRHKLLTENNYGIYVLYATGEIVLVMVGILLALQIDNWNEGRKLEQDRIKLVHSLVSDFEDTQARASIAAQQIKEIDQNLLTFMKLSVSNNTIVSVDSIRKLATYGFRQVHFQPALSSYETAIATGSIGLLKSQSLTETFSEFRVEYDNYLLHVDLGGQMMYLGSWWEIRKKLGSLHALAKMDYFLPKDYKLSDTEYRHFVAQKEIYAAFENMQWIYRNTQVSLIDLNKKSKNVLDELNKLR